MPEHIELARHVCLLALAIACAYTDMARGKLYNAVTIGGLILGLVFAGALDARAPGIPHLRDAALAAFAGGGLLFLIYLTGGIGAGDVKLMAAVGALGGGWAFALRAMMLSALVGAAMAIGVLIWQRRLLQGLRDSARVLFTLRRTKHEGAPPTTIPYGVAIAVGTVWAWVECYAM